MSSQKIVILKGSPRKKGNTCTLADALAKGAMDNGAMVEEFFLQKMDIKPCNACNACINKPAKECVIEDDMQQIYPALRSADSIVIASPIYWFNMSAQTKLVIDRLYGLVEPDRRALRGKKIAILLAYGDSNLATSGGKNAIRSFEETFQYIGATIVEIVHGSAMEAGQIKQNQQLMAAAYELGKTLSSVH
ncbi:MAG: flavodoxin family protein [Candidatus Thorarchaeota archaeon]